MATSILTPNNDKRRGTAQADSISGLAGNDNIAGLSGNDTLLGGIGHDSLDGGTDNDWLIGDTGTDTLLGGAGNDVLDGGADSDKLDGGAGADTLEGGTGADSLSGSDGNDLYLVDNIGDKVTEAAKATSGIDTVRASIDFTLPVNVENLELSDSDDLSETDGFSDSNNLKGTGNSLANRITGNAGDNELDGGEGFDTLSGGEGDDTLQGGGGVDQLIGGDGSDTYLINSTEDRITETARDGDQDVVESSVSYTLGDYVEVLALSGTANLAGTGNELANIVEGNEADNTLNGEAGDDTLQGNGGTDTLIGGAGDDEIDGGDGDDQVIYGGNRDDYRIVLDEDSQTWQVEDINGTDGDGIDEGTDRISNIETLQFADGEYIPGLPTLSVADLRLDEGSKGTVRAAVVFTLSEPAKTAVTVDYTTLDDTAVAGSDYLSATGTLTIPKGQTRQTLNLTILSDASVEADESLLLALSNAVGAQLDTSEATLTLLNDDQPRLALGNLSVDEGNSGTRKALLTVNLSQAAKQTVTVQYASTAAGTATAGDDYTPVAGNLSFRPGETSKTIAVDIKGDTRIEADENFRVQLTAPQNATLDATAAAATVTISNDDRLTLQIDASPTRLQATETASLRFVFSDSPKNFDLSDIEVTGGTIDQLSPDASGKIWTARFTPEAGNNNLEASLSVAEGRYSDANGKPGMASNTLQIDGDTAVPQLSLSSDASSLKSGETTRITLNFSENPVGFEAEDLIVSGGSLSELTRDSDPASYTALFTPAANLNDLKASIRVNSDAFYDAAGNSGQASNVLSLSGDTQAPTLTISSDKTRFRAGETATLTFRFSETPNGFDNNDLSVSGGSLGLLTGSGLIRNALFTPAANSNNLNASISLAANSYTDMIGNFGQASNVLSLSGDTQSPGLTLSSDKTSLKAGDTARLSFSFTETPTGFDTSDIIVSGGSLSGLQGSGLTRTALFTPTANVNALNASISVAANSYTDTVGNLGTASNPLNLIADTQAPSLTFSSDRSSLKIGETATLTFSFSEMPMGFDYSDIVVSGGTLGTLNGTGQTRTALFTPTANVNALNANISVAANSYTDTVGNLGTASNPLNLTADTQAPSLTLSSDRSSLKIGETATLTFSFSEMPMGFDYSDIVVSGGTLGTLNGTGQTRTALFTPTPDSNSLNANISVAANSYTDTVGNLGTASNPLNLTADTQAPSLTLSSDRSSLKIGETATLTFSFSEMPMGFDYSDIVVSGGTLGTLNGTGQTRTALFTPTPDSNNLNASISVAANSYTDTVGNLGTASNPLNLTADTQAPSLTLSSDRSSLKIGETATLTFSFSEMPMGFDYSDIVVSGGTLGTLNGTGQTRTALFTPTPDSNNLNASISVAANSYTDTVGNLGTASNPLNLTADTQAPSLTLSSDRSSLKIGETATLTFSFSEMPMGFDYSDIVVSGGTLGTLNGTGQTRTALFTPTPDSNNLNASISVAANSYTDTVGNLGTASNPLNLTADTQAPSLTLSSDRSSLKIGETATLTFSFSEMPMGFDYSDIVVSGGTLGTLNGTGQTRTALFTPTANSNNLNASISVAANSYTDAVGNAGAASNTLNLTADTQAPTLTISSDRTSLKSGDTATLTFNFSEIPTGFDNSDIIVTGGTLAMLNGAGLTRTALFTPTANSNALNASISVAANSYTDAVGNSGQASNTLNLTADTQAPSVTISSDRTSLKAGETATLSFNFSEMPTGFDNSDIAVTGGTLGTLTGTGQIRTALFTPTANSNSFNASISVAANAYTDAAGNNGAASNALSLSADTQAPTVTISSSKTSLKAGETATLSFNFSEVPTDFTASDISLSAGSLSALVADASGLVYTATYTPAANSNASASLSVAANSYTDRWGNPGTASAPLTLVLDTTLPTMTITGATLQEGNSGTTNASLTVNLSAASGQTVTVNYATQDGTAQAGSDYTITSGMLTFNAGETSKTIQVPVLGDTTVESDESFQMVLSAAVNALLNPNAASGTVQISNDDTAISASGQLIQPVIDLGSQYGKLINPVQVDGGHWFYYWDVSGDGTKANTQGTGYANSTDYVTHDWLDTLFQQDVNGRVEGENGAPVVGTDGDTDNTYRYATLNGVKLALPTVGDGSTRIDSFASRNGTAVSGAANNPTYDDYLAIWDAYNGTGTGTGIAGTPPGWGDDYGYYWSATPAASGHAGIYLGYGYVYDAFDYGHDHNSHYVAVEVL